MPKAKDVMHNKTTSSFDMKGHKIVYLFLARVLPDVEDSNSEEYSVSCREFGLERPTFSAATSATLLQLVHNTSRKYVVACMNAPADNPSQKPLVPNFNTTDKHTARGIAINWNATKFVIEPIA